MQKLPWIDALSSGGLHKTGKDAVGFQSAFRSSSEAYLAEDHQMSERLFRVIVRGRHAGTPKESKEKFLLGTCEIGPEGLGGFETKRMFADVAQLRDEAFFDLGRCLQANYWGRQTIGVKATLYTLPWLSNNLLYPHQF